MGKPFLLWGMAPTTTLPREVLSNLSATLRTAIDAAKDDDARAQEPVEGWWSDAACGDDEGDDVPGALLRSKDGNMFYSVPYVGAIRAGSAGTKIKDKVTEWSPHARRRRRPPPSAGPPASRLVPTS
jgi:hypothetical protein